MSDNSKNDVFLTCFSKFTCDKTNYVPSTLELSYPGKTYLERVYNFKITKKKKLSHLIIFRFPRSSLAVIFIFFSFGAASHVIRLPGETLSGAQLLFMSLKGSPHDWTQLFYLHILISSQNGEKPVKFLKIRCKSVITSF